MRFVDANVIVSLLVEDRPMQREDALDWLEQATADADEIVVTEAVLAEVCWVLERSYGIPRSSVARLLEQAVSTPPLESWDTELCRRALRLMRSKPALSVTDCLLAVRAGLHGVNVLTFDSKLLRELGDNE